MDPRARRFQNYRWALAVLAGLVLVLGTFIFYAVTITQSHKDESYRQTFRGLALIGQDVSENLENMQLILTNFLPAPGSKAPSETDLIIHARNGLYRPFPNKDGLDSAWKAWTRLTTDKLDDLHKTHSFKDLAVLPLWNGLDREKYPQEECARYPEKGLLISDFKETIKLVDCRPSEPYSKDQCSEVGLGDEGCTSPRFEASIPIRSLVDSSYVDELVDAVLIADFQGNVLYQSDSQNETFARVTDIKSLFRKIDDSDAKSSIAGQDSCRSINQLVSAQNGSTVICATLGGTDYLLFVQPQALPLPAPVGPKPGDAISQGHVFYIVGIKKQPDFLENLSDLPVRTVGAVLGFLVLLVIWLPIMKLRLIGSEERLHPVDAFFYFGSVLLIASGLTLLVLDYTAYTALREQMDGAAKKIGHEIGNQFHVELQESVSKLRGISIDKHFTPCDAGCTQFPDIRNTYPPYQIVTALKNNGDLFGQQITYRERMETPGRLADRPYFRAARNGTLWTLNAQDKDAKRICDQFILDRIRVRSTGDKLSVLALPAQEGCKKNEKDKNDETGNGPSDPDPEWVRTSIKTFLAFQSHLLPPFYEFAVFDDATGKVMYHSDDSRSLLEYFYAQFSKGQELRSAVEYRHAAELDGDYLGKGIALSVQPLADVPWSVAVFYDREAIQSIHFEIVAVSIAVMIGFTLLVVMLPLVFFHHVASGPRWSLMCQHQSRTKTYWWLSAIFLLEAVFILVGIWFAHAPAAVTMLQGPVLVGSLVYWTLNADRMPKWPTLAVIGGLTVSLLLSAILIEVAWADRIRVGAWPAIVMFGLGILLLAAILMLNKTEQEKTSSAPIPRIGKELAYFALGATALLLIAVVPTAGVFEETFDNHMTSLTRYGQAYIAERYIERYRTLQADAARMKPGVFSKPGATVIDVDDTLKLAGIYASLQRLFPADGLTPTDVWIWNKLKPVSTGELDGAASFGQPASCTTGGSNLQLTSWISSRLPSFDAVSEKMHGFFPKFDGLEQNCWKIMRNGQQISLSPDDIKYPHFQTIGVRPIGRWPDLRSWTGIVVLFFVVISVVMLWGIVKLAHKRFLASEIPYPIQPDSNNKKEDEEKRVAKWAKAIVGIPDVANPDASPPEWLHLLIRMPACYLDRFEEEVKQAMAGHSKNKGQEKEHGLPKKLLIKSCVGDSLYTGDRDEQDALQSKNTILILTDIHLALGSDRQLDKLLELLEGRRKGKLPTAILSDIYPLEAITHPDQYPDFNKRQAIPDPVNTARWIRLLSAFTPHIWPPRHLSKSHATLLRETQAFPDLEKVHHEVEPFCAKNRHLTDIEITELVRLHGRSFYASLWWLCTKKERVLLFGLSQGGLVNPANKGDLTHLLESGILRRDPLIRLPNLSFGRFISSVEPPERYEEWGGTSKISAWSIARIPLFALIILISVTVAFMGKQTSDYVLALLGTAATMPPLLFRLFGSFSSRPSGPPAG